MKTKILLLELNEFNRDVLVRIAREDHLDNLSWICSLPESKTTTDDTRESERLEPWVQWVSIHTGKASTEHGIRHLGEVPDANLPQIWNRLSDKGITSGVWGALNGQRGNAENCLFFVPDPWTFSEDEYPEELRGLISLPRYMAKNRTNLSYRKALLEVARLGVLVPIDSWRRLLPTLPSVVKSLIAYRLSYSVFYMYFELLSVMLFVRAAKKYQPRFLVLFLNSLAHAQHYYWTDEDDAKLRTCLLLIDEMVGLVRANLGADYKIVVANGLSQYSIIKDERVILYMLKDVEKFLVSVGLRPTGVEELMTSDSFAFFKDGAERDRAVRFLSEIKVGEHPVFKVEASTDDEKKLFFVSDFFDEVEDNSRIMFPDGTSKPFFSCLKRVHVATSRHSPTGTVFAEELRLPDVLRNDELLSFLEPHL